MAQEGQEGNKTRDDEITSIATKRSSILKKGHWVLEDQNIGALVDELIDTFVVKSKAGANLLEKTAVKHEVVKHLIRSFFPNVELGYYRVRGPTANYVSTHNGPEMHGLAVQAWSSGSKWKYLQGSHLDILKRESGGQGWLSIPESRVNELIAEGKATPVELEMPQGGLALVDVRLGFQIMEGKAYHMGWMTPEEAKKWIDMSWPTCLKKEIEPLKGNGFGFKNIVFEDGPSSTVSNQPSA